LIAKATDAAIESGAYGHESAVGEAVRKIWGVKKLDESFACGWGG
jgi:hypothetical protein